MPSWWTPRATATAQWQRATTNSPQPARAAVPPTPMTPAPSSAQAIAPPLYPGRWTTRHPKAPGTGHTRTRLWRRPRTRTRTGRTPSLQPRQSQASLRLPPERACAVFAEPRLYMTWKASGPIPRWRSGTDTPVKVRMSCNQTQFFISKPVVVKRAWFGSVTVHCSPADVSHNIVRCDQYPKCRALH